jgi:hypothetical protein
VSVGVVDVLEAVQVAEDDTDQFAGGAVAERFVQATSQQQPVR